MPIPAGFPNASNTGVPQGTVLTAYTGPMTASAAGTVIENTTITGQLRVTGNNVIIRRCRLTFSGQWGIDAEGSSGILVEDCTLTGPGTGGNSNSPFLGSGTIRRCNISQAENGIVLQDGPSTVVGNYIHDLNDSGTDPHFDGISVQGGQNGVLIADNTVIAKDTSCVFIKDDFGPINNVTVRHNYLEGPVSTTIYVDGRANGGPITNVLIEKNVILHTGGDFYYVDGDAQATIRDNFEYTRAADVPASDPTNPTEPPPVADTITLVAVTIADPAMGIVSIVNGKLRYTPAVDYSGPANGTYTIRDGAGQESSSTWSRVIGSPPNPPPLAVADHDATPIPFGTPFVDVDVLANDFADTP